MFFLHFNFLFLPLFLYKRCQHHQIILLNKSFIKNTKAHRPSPVGDGRLRNPPRGICYSGWGPASRAPAQNGPSSGRNRTHDLPSEVG
ncbi:hypothetical protein F5144DRAFT_567374 [Chaetomium tenue]|uniref:Uncharacterized protein n=1 Tax=Chaetomium tenue TaxID=1854479 RepID=A0ACB7PDL8_9PEZI|nr:hypothetical protein F5144DRAFT_567374 [Chaetomium globosum]